MKLHLFDVLALFLSIALLPPGRTRTSAFAPPTARHAFAPDAKQRTPVATSTLLFGARFDSDRSSSSSHNGERSPRLRGNRQGGGGRGGAGRQRQRGRGRGGRGQQQQQQQQRRPRRREAAAPANVVPPAHSYYVATCLPGMAEILQQELISLGCCQEVQVSGKSAVFFGVPSLEAILTVLLWTRTAHKVMELLCSTGQDNPVYTRDDLYQFIRSSTPVEDLLLVESRNSEKEQWLTLSCSVTLNNARYLPDDINHSHYTALQVKNALVDAAREASRDGRGRPSVDTANADAPLVVVVRGIRPEEEFAGRTRQDGPANTVVDATFERGAHVSVYRCLHAGSLHRRGYRRGTAVHKAALKESTAAGLLLNAKWHESCSIPNSVFVDPMAGSGTFCLEAGMMAADLAPGLMRIKCGVPAALDPPILRWNHNDNDNNEVRDIWNNLLREATARARAGLASMKEKNVRIMANDMHGGALDLAEHAVRQAGLSQVIELHQGDCLDWNVVDVLVNNDDDAAPTTDTRTTAFPPWTVVSNPPWGVRLTEDMHESWEALRLFLRERCPAGTEAYILSGSADATKHLGLQRSASLPLKTGQVDMRWLKYVIRDRNAPRAAAKTAAGSSVGAQRQQQQHHHHQKPPQRQERGPSRSVSSERPKREPTKTAASAGPAENEWLI